MANTLRRTAIQVAKKRNAVASTITRQSSSTTTEKNLLTSVFKDIVPSNFTVSDFVWEKLDRWPDKTATRPKLFRLSVVSKVAKSELRERITAPLTLVLAHLPEIPEVSLRLSYVNAQVCAVTGRGYTYAQTHRMSVSLAASLRTRLKLQNGDKVAVLLPNLPEYPCALLGVLQAGCVASMMNPIYTTEELKHQFELIDCKAIISSKISYPNIQKALNGMNVKIPVILVENEDLPEGTIKFAEFAEDLTIDTDCLKKVQRSPDDVAVLPFSSGTTGFPKGVVLTHRSVVAYNQMSADPEIVSIKETTATYQAVFPAVLPFFHIFGFNALMINQMSLGCKIVTLPYFKPELFLQTLVNHKANALFIVPPMALFLGKHPAVTPAHLETVHAIICGAAPLAETDIAEVIKKNKNIVFRQGYGLTETNGGTSVGKNDCTNHSAVGHIMGSCKVKIADVQTQEALGPGKEGEIWVRGALLMKEYYKNEAATREVLTDDGWFKTGDIGKYDENKYLYITDRMKELIKVKGYQVPPAELEKVLRTHPKIVDCAVLGIPDPISGEVPKAFVVTQSGQKVGSDEILDFVNKKVAAFKNIKEVQFVDEIPKNAAGKILRKDLKEKYC